MKTRLPILIGLLAALNAAQDAYGANPGVTAAPILQVPVGARAVGMGGAFSAVASDVSGLYYNPAGLSNLDFREVSFMYLNGIQDQTLEYIALGTPLSLSGFIGDGFAALGASVLFSQNGDIEFNRLSPNGTLLESRTLRAGGDLVVTLGYSERVAHFEIPTRFGDYEMHHFMGLSGKLIRSTLAETYTAQTFALDIGYLMKIPEARFSFSAFLRNLGDQLRFIDDGDPLPQTIGGGFAFKPKSFRNWIIPAEQSLLFSADGEYLIFERDWNANVGMEYSVMSQLALRLGYRINREALGLTFGFGASWRGFGIDYGWGMNDDLSDSHRISITYRFGRMGPRRREGGRRPFIESMPEREDLRELEQETPQTIDRPRRPRRQAPENRRVAPGWIY